MKKIGMFVVLLTYACYSSPMPTDKAIIGHWKEDTTNDEFYFSDSRLTITSSNHTIGPYAYNVILVKPDSLGIEYQDEKQFGFRIVLAFQNDRKTALAERTSNGLTGAQYIPVTPQKMWRYVDNKTTP